MSRRFIISLKKQDSPSSNPQHRWAQLIIGRFSKRKTKKTRLIFGLSRMTDGSQPDAEMPKWRTCGVWPASLVTAHRRLSWLLTCWTDSWPRWGYGLRHWSAKSSRMIRFRLLAVATPVALLLTPPIFSLQIQQKHLSCVSLSCLHMAAKVTEEECNLTPSDELIRIGQCRFTVSDLGRMEKIITEKLNFKPKAITALTFLHLYHQITISYSTDRWEHYR